MEDLLAALDNKNPSIKEETCKFLTRTFCGCTQASLPKSALKQMVPVLIKVSSVKLNPLKEYFSDHWDPQS